MPTGAKGFTSCAHVCRMSCGCNARLPKGPQTPTTSLLRLHTPALLQTLVGQQLGVDAEEEIDLDAVDAEEDAEEEVSAGLGWSQAVCQCVARMCYRAEVLVACTPVRSPLAQSIRAALVWRGCGALEKPCAGTRTRLDLSSPGTHASLTPPSAQNAPSTHALAHAAQAQEEEGGDEEQGSRDEL